MQRRHFLSASLCLMGLGATAFSVHAQVINSSDAINKAGRQRMLSQRIAKAYLQLGLAVDVAQSTKIFENSLSLFDRQLVELKHYAPTADIKADVLASEKIWLNYKDILLGRAPNAEDAKQVIQISDILLAQADRVTQLLEKHANTRTAQWLNLSGRQRMLSQRMAKLYQAIQWGISGSEMPLQLEAARKEFISNMRVLESAPVNTPALEQELKLAKLQWDYFDHAIRQTPDTRMRQRDTTTVATTSERILAQMDIVTGLYQAMKI